MEDYGDASDRHFQDAKTLHDQVPSRLANASHLYGVSAECALKCIMERKGRVPKGNTGHLPDLLVEFKNHSAAKGNARLINQLKKHAEGLQSWHISQRYFAQAAFQKEIVESEAESARKIRVLNLHHARGII